MSLLLVNKSLDRTDLIRQCEARFRQLYFRLSWIPYMISIF